MGNWELPEDNTLDIEDVKADGSENDGVRISFQLSVSICTLAFVIFETPSFIFLRYARMNFLSIFMAQVCIRIIEIGSK